MSQLNSNFTPKHALTGEALEWLLLVSPQSVEAVDKKTSANTLLATMAPDPSSHQSYLFPGVVSEVDMIRKFREKTRLTYTLIC